MSLTTFPSLSHIPMGAQLWPFVRSAFCHVVATLADIPRRARDHAILQSLDFQMLNDIGQTRVTDELAKPLWRA
ncbi:MAG: hypothetical protein ACREFO_12955 [Acetobacteraceae bacterium]